MNALSGLLDHSYCKLGDDVFIFICCYFIIGPLGIFNIIKIYYYHFISHVGFMCDNNLQINFYQNIGTKITFLPLF